MTNNKITNIQKNLKPEFWDKIINDMNEVIYNTNGTGKSANPDISGLNVFGKTGTAENPHGNTHAWFVGWAEYNEENYSMVILLENAGSGGSVAAPMARKILKRMFNDIQVVKND